MYHFYSREIEGFGFGYSHSNVNHMNVQAPGSRSILSQYFPNHRRRLQQARARSSWFTSQPTPRFYRSDTPTQGAHLFCEKGAGPGPLLFAQPAANLLGCQHCGVFEDPVGHLSSGPGAELAGAAVGSR